VRYQFAVDTPTTEWDFGRITWPPELVLPWRKTESEPRASSKVDDPQEPLRLTSLEKRIKAYLSTVDIAVEGEGGSNTTFRVACLLVNGWALKRGDAIRWMHYYSLNRCRPPWSDEEIEHKVDDARDW
jgi:hypothetical protein